MSIMGNWLKYLSEPFGKASYIYALYEDQTDFTMGKDFVLLWGCSGKHSKAASRRENLTMVFYINGSYIKNLMDGILRR